VKYSRQIIYPNNYFLIFKNFVEKNTTNTLKEILLKKIPKIFNYTNNYIFIGRARTGIFLLVKIFLKAKKPKVAMSPFTIPDVVNMVICAGGVPVFVDFEKKTTFLNLDQLEIIFKKNECSILILTHYNINEKNYLNIKNLCTNYNIKLVEDCAIAAGGASNGIKIGTLCDGAIYSFSSFKFLNFFWGGMVYIKNNQLFEQVNSLTKSWKTLSFIDYLSPIISSLKFDFLTSRLIFNYFTFNLLQINLHKSKNLVNKQYADFEVGKLNKTYFTLPSEVFYSELSRKIDNFYSFQEKRVKSSLIYYNLLSKFSVPYNISEDLIINSSCYNYLIYSENKKALRVKLAKLGFDTGFSMYQNSHKFPNYSQFDGYSDEVDNLIENSIVLPTHYLITEKYAEQLSQAILSNYS
jgi:perosamine synthetase